MEGYFGISNVSVQCMLVQETLMFFKYHDLSEWRCSLSDEFSAPGTVLIDHSNKVVTLFLSLVRMDYTEATVLLHNKLYDFMGRRLSDGRRLGQ